MTPVGWTILILLLLAVSSGLELVADALRLRAGAKTVPSEFSEQYPAEVYAKAGLYSRERARVSMVEQAVTVVAFLIFWFAGGFPWLDGLAARGSEILGGGEIARGLVFIGGLAFGGLLLALPFGAWRTFVVEERFGFNRTSPGRFVRDVIMGLAVGVILGAPIVALILWLLARADLEAWVTCWIALVAYRGLVAFVVPRWVLPLFWRFDPLPEGGLRAAIIDYSRRIGFPIENVFVIDGSRRSTKSNAFFAGFGRARRLALFDTLIERHDPEEILAVVAHEVGHYKRGHIAKGMLWGLVHDAAFLALLALVLDETALFAAFGIEGTPVHVGLVLFGLLWSPVGLFARVILNAISRRHEYEADRFAAQTTGAVEPLVRALKKLSRDNLVDLEPHALDVVLRASHPPMPARIDALRSYAGSASAS